MDDRQQMQMPQIIKVVGVIAGVFYCLLAVCLIGAGIFISRISKPDLDPRPFDSQVWKQCAKSVSGNKHWQSEEIRQSMVRDLITKRKIIGMKESALVGLLGPDDGYVKTKTSDELPGVWQYTYRLGAASLNPMNLGVRVLLIRVNDGCVSEFKIKQYHD